MRNFFASPTGTKIEGEREKEREREGRRDLPRTRRKHLFWMDIIRTAMKKL